MIKQLISISENLVEAAELLKAADLLSENKPIENLVSENAYKINDLEKYSASLVENIKLTIKSIKI